MGLEQELDEILRGVELDTRSAMRSIVAHERERLSGNQRFDFPMACVGLYLFQRTILPDGLQAQWFVRKEEVERLSPKLLPSITYIFIPEDEMKANIKYAIDYAIEFGYLIELGEWLIRTKNGKQIIQPVMEIEAGYS